MGLSVVGVEAAIAPAAFAAPATPTYGVTDTVSVGSGPGPIAVNPSTGRVYVGNQADRTVSVLTTPDDTVAATVPVGGTPFSVAVNRTTGKAYVTTGTGGSGDHPGDLVALGASNSVLDSRSLQQDGDGPHFGVAVNSVTDSVYVTHFYGNSVTEYSGTTIAPTSPTFWAGPIVTGVAVDELTDTVYVANLNDGTVTVVNGTTHLSVATIPVGGRAGSIAVDPSRHTAYVNTEANTVAVIDTRTNTVAATVPVGHGPGNPAVDPGAGVVYVANNQDDTVSVIDEETNAVTATVKVGSHPSGVAVNPGTHTAYVTNNGSNTVSVIRTLASAPVVTNVPADAVAGGSFTATVDTNGDGTRSVSSSTPRVCTTDGLKVALVGVGTCTLTAAVGAGTEYGAASGSPQSFDVSKAATTTAVTAPGTATAGDEVTITAHVAPAPAGSLIPTGTVDFYLDGSSTAFATKALGADGTASFTTRTLPVGSDSIVAVYSGDSSFTGSTSKASTVTVSPAATPSPTTTTTGPAAAPVPTIAPTRTTLAQAPAGELARTGSDPVPLALAGFALLAAGAGAIALSRRRPQGQHSF
jgi:YVTN family beta-propeller protein